MLSRRDGAPVDGSRRTFLIGGVSTAALGLGTYAWLRSRGYRVDAPIPPGGGPSRAPVAPLPQAAFPPRARAALTPLVGVLLPGDPEIRLPSGPESGVPDYLERACRLPGLRPVRDDILKLTRYLDRAAQSLRGFRFSELRDPADQVEVVAQATADHAPTGRFVPARALEVALRLSLEGYLGHPEHGGNQGAKVWDALQIPMPRQREAGHEHR